MTFTRHVQQRRIARAVRLLRDPQRTITEICFACGFNSLTHLNRVFRKFHHCAPTEYRGRLRRSGPVEHNASAIGMTPGRTGLRRIQLTLGYLQWRFRAGLLLL